MLPVILWISDSPHLPTGFGRVTKEICRRLVAGGALDVNVLAIGADDSACANNNHEFRMWPHPKPAPDKQEIQNVIRALKPSIVITLSNLWASTYMLDIAGGWEMKWIGYFPIDAGPLPGYFLPIVQRMDHRVTTSDYSATVFRQYFPQMDISVIRHGVDVGVFHPCGCKPVKPLLPDGRKAFVVGCVARNQPRKGIPVLIEAFARLAERHSDVMLHLHTNPWDVDGWVLRELLAQHGVADRTSFTETMLRFESLSDIELCNVYRFFDVFALPTMGEGFCIPILEAMACGVPVVATAGSAVTELLNGRGELVPPVAAFSVPPHGFKVSLPDGGKFAEALEKIYDNSRLRTKYAREGRKFAEAMTWDRCADQWLKLLSGLSIPYSRRLFPMTRGDRNSLVTSVVVLLPDGAHCEPFKGSDLKSMADGLDDANICETIAVIPPGQEKCFDEIRTALEPDALLLRSSARLNWEERMRLAVRASRGVRVQVVVPDESFRENNAEVIRMEGKEVRITCISKGRSKEARA